MKISGLTTGLIYESFFTADANFPMLNSNFAVSVPADSGEDFLLSITHSQYEDIEIVIDSECLSSCVNNQVSLPDLQERIVATPGYLPADDSNLVTTRESSYYKSSFGCIDSV
mgnify:CR=1 FL=1